MTAVTAPTWKFVPDRAFALAVTLAVVFAGFRAVGTLGPVALRVLLPVGFVLMALTPWMLLTHEGRREIGFRPADGAIYLRSVVLGATAALPVF